MKINLENLFYMVQGHFVEVEEYHKVRLQCLTSQWGERKNCTLYVEHLTGAEARSFTRHHERANHGENALSDLCNVLGINKTKLYGISKAIIKWHEKRNWQVSFPFEKNSNAILGYIGG